MAAGLAAGGRNSVTHGERDGGTKGKGSGVGEEEVVVDVMDAGALEGVKRVNGEQEELGDAEEPYAEAGGVAAAVGEVEDQRPDEVELLFDGQGPEVVEGQGGVVTEGIAGEVGEVLQEEDEDQQRLELREMGAGEQGGDGGGEQRQDVERKDAESAAGVEVTQAVGGMVGFPKAARDEEAGEGEEENDAAPAELGEVAEEALGGVGGLETAVLLRTSKIL